MIRKRLLVTGLAMSMCLNQMPPTVLVRASQNTNSNSKFEVEVNNSKASRYGYIKPAGQSYATNPKSKLKKAAQLPARYGSIEKDVRDQNPFGTCWAFAGTGSFEYAVDKKTGSNTDYSEEHMIQRLSKNGDTGYQITSKDTGGNEYMYSGYFTSGYGPVSDSLFPYDTTKSTLQIIPSILNAKGNYRATDVQFFKTTDDANGALNSETVNTVKQAVYNNGSATCGITWDSSMIQEDKVSYYNSDDNARNDSNHEVLIVGWDDDYSADHFEGVTKNGAWLVRNSWGNNIGDNGYFWVSYQDKSLIPSCTIRSYEEVSDDDTIYNLDESGALYPQVTYDGTSQVGFINSFSLKKREKLKEVTFYEAETGSQYQLFYVPVKDDGSLDIGNKQAITEKKTLDFPGYHTEKITKEINAKKAAIMVMIDSNEDSAGLGAEGSISDGRKKLYIPTLEKGQSYIYVDNEVDDLYDMGTNFGNWSIKLVTEKADSAFYAKDHKNSTDLGSFQWTGRSVKPSIGDIVSEDDGSVLKQGTDYELEYENNVDPGTATVTVKGIGKYKGYEQSFTYTIGHKTFTVENHKNGDSLGKVKWTGKELKCDIGTVVDASGKRLEENKDYTVAYSNNVEPGTATVKVTGLGEYKDNSYKFSFEIEEDCGYGGFYDEKLDEEAFLGTFKWTGEEIRKHPENLKCKHCNRALVEGTDYMIRYSDNVDPGTATVKVIGMGQFEGTEKIYHYTIKNKTFHSGRYENGQNLGTLEWTGKEVKFDIGQVVSDHQDVVLKEDTDYKITYSNNINPGTAKVEITGLGDYKGCSLSYTYTIHKTETPVKPSEDTNPSHNDSTTETKKESLTIATDPENAIYNGKNITRKVIVRSGNEVLTEGRDYKITYSNNKNCGIVTMKIIGIGNHQGTITKTFKIAPKKASLKKVKSSKKTATLYIRKSSGGVTRYQIRYSYKKNFKSSKYKVSKKTTYKIKGLKRKKQVYVKIRAYKQVGKAKIYGSWSNSKKVKIK